MQDIDFVFLLLMIHSFNPDVMTTETETHIMIDLKVQTSHFPLPDQTIEPPEP